MSPARVRFGVVESTYHVVLRCEMDNFRILFHFPSKISRSERKVVVVISQTVGVAVVLIEFNV